jgi:SAM-dependent methyltransferase|tara:strand:- start:450 stop:1085 length:636 start_codon:yes stop_codon:yes gene_type:complete
MKEQPKDFWNERYNVREYIYGTSPNPFLKEQLSLSEPGNILLPAEGEGRNAVYAAKQGWNVTAFDSSSTAKKKALKLAVNENVKINYQVSDVLKFTTGEQFDVLGLIYAHFPKNIRQQAHQHLLQFLKPNGKVFFEAFAKEQLKNSSGGPKTKEMLFSVEEIQEEFSGLKFEFLEQQTILLDEGEYHKGEAEVIRFLATKNDQKHLQPNEK